MTSSLTSKRDPLSLRLPATSANLGPGFDALALALALYLEVDASPANEFSIEASGRSPEVCGALDQNLLIETYKEVSTTYANGRVQPLTLTVRNGIPLGMGCGSSAASRLAAIALASHFGGFGWSRGRMLDEAARFERHPDNAAACCLGGFVASGLISGADGELSVSALSITPPPSWYALLVLPEQPLATTASRAVLPASYPRAHVVANLQNVALLVAAFAQGDAAALAQATRDSLHQPYRGEVCPLLPKLTPLAGSDGILSVTLSGAGSGVLLLLEGKSALRRAAESVHQRALSGDSPTGIQELLPCDLATTPAVLT